METLKRFKEFVDEIQQNNSRNYKLEVLQKYKNDLNVKYYLNFIFNPYIITGISKKKINKFSYSDVCLYQHVDKTVKEMLEYIKLNNTGKDEVLIALTLFKSNLCELNEESNEYVELFDKIVCKELSLGIDVLSINKVIPNLIPTFNVQLANKYFDKPEYVEGKEFTITTKIDGGRIIAIKENGIVKFYTRAGQLYEGLVDLEEVLSKCHFDNFALDGEITLLDKGDLSSKDQYKQTMKITRKDGEKHGVKMLVFDIMNSTEFKTQRCPVPYIQRQKELQRVLSGINSKYFEHLKPLYSGSDINEINILLNDQVNKGEEGIMININSALYSFKRTNDLLKVKKMNTMDLEVIGFEEGTGNFKGTLGAILCKYRDNYIVKVGSGFKLETRNIVWKNKDDYLGLTAEIQYFEETENQQGGKSLRFPVFVDWRYDK